MGYAGNDASFSELRTVGEWMQVLALSVAALANAWNAAFMFSLVGFMAVEFGVSENLESSGFYAGYLGSAIMLGAVLNATVIGYIGDRYGRRPVILLGCFGIGISNLALVFVNSYWTAVALRFLGGLLNGIVPTTKVLCAELLDGRYPSTLMTIIMGMWSVCVTFSPAISGILTPVSVLKASQLGHNATVPLFTPPQQGVVNVFYVSFAVASIVGFASLLLCQVYLPETLTTKQNSPKVIHKTSKVTSQQHEEHQHPTHDIPQTLFEGDILLTIGIYTIWAFLQFYIDETVPIWMIASVEAGGLGYSPADTGEVLGLTGIVMLLSNFVVYPMLSQYFSLVHLFALSTTASGFGSILESSLSNAAAVAGYPQLALIVASLTNGLRSAGLTIGFTCVAQLCNNASPKHLRGKAAALSFLTASVGRTLAPTIGTVLFAWSISGSSSTTEGVTHPPQDYHVPSQLVPHQTHSMYDSLINFNLVFWLFGLCAFGEAIAALMLFKPHLEYSIDLPKADKDATPELELQGLLDEEVLVSN